MVRRLITLAAIIGFIGIITLALIVYARGFRFNLEQKSITTTGILSVSSYPDKASLLVDGKLVSATNASVSLAPNWYDVRVSKEGYQSWEKRIRIQAEIVSQIDALLIPINPSLKALTVTGIMTTTLSPSGTRVAYIIPAAQSTTTSSFLSKSGVWVLELRTGALGNKVEPKQVFPNSGLITATFDWENTRLFWSPDEKQLVLTFIKKENNQESITAAYEINLDNDSSVALDTTTSLNNLFAEWKNIQSVKENASLDSLPTIVSSFLQNWTSDFRPSPDDTKILYLATASAVLSPVISPPILGSNPTAEVRTIQSGKFYIYDLKEDKNYFVADLPAQAGKKNLTGINMPSWYSDSKHIVMIEKDTINIMDYDGTNMRVIFAGPFETNVLYPWPSGGQLVILTKLNRPKILPNLYQLDLR